MKSLRAGEFLEDIGDRGYPLDYLCARLRGRRARMIKDWRTLVYGTSPPDVFSRGGSGERAAGGIGTALLREYRWVYRQMNGGLRSLLTPYFLYAELRTLFIGLRRIREGRSDEAADLLSASLLSVKIKGILAAGEKPGQAVAALERVFRSLSAEFAGLAAAFEEKGPRAFEELLTNRYLSHVANAGLHPVLRAFFSRIIDARNVLSLYKAIRLGAGELPVFPSGGRMTSERFHSVLKGGDLRAAGALVREAAGMRIDSPDIAKVEGALYRGITIFLRKEGRDPLGIGLLLDYLWRCSLEAMNLSILSRTREIERESVIAELAY